MKISSIREHIHNGTFFQAAKDKLARQFGKSPDTPVNRWNIDTEEGAISFLSDRAAKISGRHPGKKIFLIAQEGAARDSFQSKFREKNISAETISIEHLSALEKENPSSVACIVCGYFDARRTMRVGKFLVSNERMREIPFEYILISKQDFSAVEKHDRYQTGSFTSPLFAQQIDYISIYEESLTKFQQKCDIRDYLDLCQSLNHIAKNNIPGDVAEFGSYRGHSGYLITQTLKQLNASKKILLFDMFESFPSENLGIDYFWEEHTVNYEEVKTKFAPFSNVQLVKGDFTKTILDFPDITLSFIYMDCDSYRATKFLVEHLFEKHLSRGGMIVFEDYGHPALLGNRVAVHECFDHRKDCFTFYSQFSGFYIVLKTGDSLH